MDENQSFFAPYKKIYNYYDAAGADTSLLQIRDYLMCMPFPGGEIADDNRNPRVRLMKYLLIDTANPLDAPLPSIQDRRAVVFDPERPDNPPTALGYRIFTQSRVAEAQLVGQSTLNIYIGRVIPKDSFSTQVSVNFLIGSSFAYEANTKTDVLSRTWAMECAIVEALNGVNMQGVGSFAYATGWSGDTGSSEANDQRGNVFRLLRLAYETRGGDWDATQPDAYMGL